MKKIIYILFAALLGAVSCTVSEPEFPSNPEEGTVTLMMKVSFPELFVQTKSSDMAVNPNIDNIYVATFGTEHFLNDYVQAIPCDEDGNPISNYSGLENDTDFFFKVTLNSTQTKRYVHVIANGPAAVNYHDPEDELMKKLTTSGTTGAYWTYFVLPNGTYDPDPVSGDNRAENYFRNLKLIRNFARVSVSLASSVTNFSLTGYQVYNTPTHGSVAIWSENAQGSVDSGNSGYFPGYSDKTMSELLTSYTAFMPDDEINNAQPTSTTTYSNTEDKFVFERPDRDSNRPYIIMQGRYTGDSADTFYRLDFVDPDGNYLPILRNFEYKIQLTAVTKSGAADPTQAKSSNANVSALAETANLSDISDGTSRMYVQWLDQSYMDAGQRTFKYMYLKDAGEDTRSSLAELSIRSGAGEAIVGATASAAFTQSLGSDGWYTVTFSTNSAGSSEKATKFRVTGVNDQGQKLYRDIVVHVLPTQEWGTASAAASGSNVTVTVTLPTGLPSSLFPLEISFEDSQKALNPVGLGMPAKVGPSIVPGNTNTSYQFVKTVSYLEYNPAAGGSNVVTCEFKRVRNDATRLYFYNQYFAATDNYVDIN
ncbi:MAG: hypothetical protein J5490_07185 [Bacteroidales bacterium]|nr:hypothetical protein [Bacteroidales bacterium]